MSMLAEVAQKAGVNRRDVARFLEYGGTTAQDWAIARAIEAVGGRRAADLILTAGWDRIVAEWRNVGSTPEPTPADRPEPPAPEPEPVPAADDPIEAISDDEVRELAVSVYSDLTAYAHSEHTAKRILKRVGRAGSLSAARRVLHRELLTHPRTRRFSRCCAAPEIESTAALAA
jgi:hypothetical protein